MPYLKIFGGLAAVILALLAIGEIQRLHVRSERLADCQAMAEVGIALHTGDTCPKSIKSALERAALAAHCDQGLGPAAPQDLAWAAPLACSAPVRQLAADQNAAWANVQAREAELTTLRAGQTAALDRAYQRGLTQARRDANVQRAIEAAPRDSAGLVLCGADCLRQLAGEAAPRPGRRGPD